jgi:GAF domain-containing protein
MTERPGEPRRPERSAAGDQPDEQAQIVRPRAAPDEAETFLDLGQVMGDIARTIQSEHGDVDRTLAAITGAARDAIPGADSVSVSFVTGRIAHSRAATDELPQLVDELQSRLDEGPCLDALREQSTVRVDDATTEKRWPGFAAEATKIGMGSSVSFQLFVEGDTLGALNVYSDHAYAFDEESESIGLVFASHASIALAAARQEENLRRAMDHRDLIGQAKGILMERHRLTAEQAFHVLARTSTHTNRKLFELAEELTTTGTMPEQ